MSAVFKLSGEGGGYWCQNSSPKSIGFLCQCDFLIVLTGYCLRSLILQQNVQGRCHLVIQSQMEQSCYLLFIAGAVLYCVCTLMFGS